MNKYPKFSEMPYRSTTVSAERSKAQITELLEKYDIEDHQWTKIQGKESLKFIIDTVVQGKHIKKAVQLDIPTIKARKGRNNEVIDVSRDVVYRILYNSLKSILETTKYGILALEDILFSYILTQLPDGRTVTIKEALNENQHLLPEITLQ